MHDNKSGHSLTPFLGWMQRNQSVADEKTRQQDPSAQHPTTIALKKCTDCGKYKAMNAFARRQKSRDGRAYNCRTCDAKRVRLIQKPQTKKEFKAIRSRHAAACNRSCLLFGFPLHSITPALLHMRTSDTSVHGVTSIQGVMSRE